MPSARNMLSKCSLRRRETLEVLGKLYDDFRMDLEEWTTVTILALFGTGSGRYVWLTEAFQVATIFFGPFCCCGKSNLARTYRSSLFFVLQINWDAPGNILPFDMPFNFFDKTVTRGIVFQAAKREFRVSNPAPAPPANDDRFSTLIGRAQSRRFQRFSDPRLFTPIEGNRVTSIFKIPAKNRRANTAGFGAVFTDVDLARTTWMAFYDRKGCLIRKLYIPPRSRGLSFGGIIVKNRGKNLPVIYRVVINLGNVSFQRVGRTYRPGGRRDLVVLDDLFYGEPQ